MILKLAGGAIAYYHAPKCGSRMVLAWGALLDTPGLLDEHPAWFASSRRGEYPELRRRATLWPESRHDWDDATLVPQVAAPVRFCIVRGPVDRFVSGFTNRIVFHESLSARKMSIAEFLADFDVLAANEANRLMARHFLPQSCFYGRDVGMFTHVFSMACMDEQRALLERHAGRALPDLRLQQSGGLAKPPLSLQDVAWIKERYAEDYEVFGGFL